MVHVLPTNVALSGAPERMQRGSKLEEDTSGGWKQREWALGKARWLPRTRRRQSKKARHNLV